MTIISVLGNKTGLVQGDETGILQTFSFSSNIIRVAEFSTMKQSRTI